MPLFLILWNHFYSRGSMFESSQFFSGSWRRYFIFTVIRINLFDIKKKCIISFGGKFAGKGYPRTMMIPQNCFMIIDIYHLHRKIISGCHCKFYGVYGSDECAHCLDVNNCFHINKTCNECGSDNQGNWKKARKYRLIRY